MKVIVLLILFTLSLVADRVTFISNDGKAYYGNNQKNSTYKSYYSPSGGTVHVSGNGNVKTYYDQAGKRLGSSYSQDTQIKKQK